MTRARGTLATVAIILATIAALALQLAVTPAPVCHGGRWYGSNGAVSQWMPRCHLP